jgi:formate C-acetyltransferase
MMHYRQKEAGSGFVAQMKFSRSVFCTEEGMNAFISLAKTYFENGGQQLSINVVDRATLLAAKAEPEKYKNLIVRVGGYSDYFYNLSDELKQNVIDRSEFAL